MDAGTTGGSATLTVAGDRARPAGRGGEQVARSDLGGYVTVVLRAETPLSLELVVAAAHAIRRSYLCAPLLDVERGAVTCPSPGRGGTLRPAAEAAIAAVERASGIRPWAALVPSQDPDDDAAVVQGERWIELASRLVAPRVVEISDANLIRRLVEERQWTREMARMLDPLIEHDQRQRTNVLRTLECVLLDVSTQQRAAHELGIERHTITRHLKTAAAVLGRDPRWGVDRMILEQALLARRCLRDARAHRPRPTSDDAGAQE